MGLFRAIDTSASGLTAERLRMDVISNNIANVNTTRTEDGGPFRRQLCIFQARRPGHRWPFSDRTERGKSEIGSGVRVASIMSDQAPFKLLYDPNHPDADKDGYVRLPNINIVHEMVDMITCTRAYEANVTSINATKDIVNAALGIGRR
ncbi:MAG TPA: flagellar basal body rod protein FlgC [Candidatus Ozemobacteraceae bacterium]|nr:flagellar basal body rod protein FlgC [Candidatus Ozemobacteraceae bacterium]